LEKLLSPLRLFHQSFAPNSDSSNERTNTRRASVGSKVRWKIVRTRRPSNRRHKTTTRSSGCRFKCRRQDVGRIRASAPAGARRDLGEFEALQFAGPFARWSRKASRSVAVNQMPKRVKMRFRSVRALAALVLANLVADTRADETGDALFVRRVGPLLQTKCAACHGNNPAKLEGGLDLRTRAGVLRGGESGEASLVVGKPEASPLYLAAGRKHESWSAMPPKEAERLNDTQLVWLKQWIAAGAPWPDENRTRAILKANTDRWSAEDGVTVKTGGGLSPEWTDRKYKVDALWAYQPVRQPAVTKSGSAAVDELVARRMPEGLSVAPPANARTFIRRATFDLIGLPPTPSEVAAFEIDFARDADAAVRRLIDRLLAGPHYGERMAQHWLDVVRYADSSGFANDFTRGNAWRYRDHVVRAFSNDKPYDAFVRDQIAGDEIDPTDPDRILATGFLRMGPWELTAMEVARIARQRFLDDVTNSVGETFLAHSLQCARCHDHKFDPIPTRDYYSIQAVFATTQLAERPAPFLPIENIRGFDEKRFLELGRRDHVATLNRLDEKSLQAADAWYADKKLDPAPWRAAVRQAGNPSRGTTFAAARGLLLKQGLPEDRFPPRMLGWTPEEIGLERIARKGLERLTWELERYEPFALAVYNGRTPQVTGVVRPTRIPIDRMSRGELEDTCILTGGDPFASGAKVKPGVLTVVGSVPAPAFPEGIEGRRKAFAEWVAHKDNPLTTRTIVNRVWMWHFGDPIAGNPNNFGAAGKRPTHPELLDWLAAEFVGNGWSIKALHRLIMNSAAYRRDTAHPDRATWAKLDPAATSLAVFKPRRLSAEELRDAMLSITGELNPEIGGIPNRPEINLEAALQPRQVMGTFASAWTPNPLPKQRHRRTLYALKLRGLTDPALEVFNAPAPDFSCERRDVSTVTPQVFALFNGWNVHMRALAFAKRLLTETASDEAALTRAFQLTFSRSPTADESAACLEHWRAMERIHAETKIVLPDLPLQVRRDAVEENTGEKFSFEEKLHSNAGFVPDLRPADCDVRTRALADVCLVLFNSNEFAYVY